MFQYYAANLPELPKFLQTHSVAHHIAQIEKFAILEFCFGKPKHYFLVMNREAWRAAVHALHCNAWASHCSGFSCCGTQAPGTWASVVAAQGLSSCSVQVVGLQGFSNCGLKALEHRLSSCGTWAQVLYGMWNHLGSGIKPVSSALAGGVQSIPPAKSHIFCLV